MTPTQGVGKEGRDRADWHLQHIGQRSVRPELLDVHARFLSLSISHSVVVETASSSRWRVSNP